MESDEIKIVNVVDDFGIYKKIEDMRSSTKKYETFSFDNTKDHLGIPSIYNEFLSKYVSSGNSDFWIVFCQQDFGFLSDPYDILKNLDKKCIYGVVAPKKTKNWIKLLKSYITSKMDYYPSVKIDIKALIPFSKHKLIEVRKKNKRNCHFTKHFWGQIKDDNFDLTKNGIYIDKPITVGTVNSCCLIVHSSLIYEHNLRFDENLKKYMYVEDFCINTRRNYGILTKVVQFDCFLSNTKISDDIDDDFYESVEYVKQKYNIGYINSTCID